MKKYVSVLLIVSLLLCTFSGCGKTKKTDEKETATKVTTTETTSKESTTAEETTKTSEVETTKATNKSSDKKYNAPKKFSSKGDAAEYIIDWQDDNSVKIIDTAYGDDGSYYYDIKINQYGEVVKITNYFTDSDDNGSEYTDKRDYWYEPKYNDQHWLIGAIEKNEDGSTYREWQYFYNDKGQRIKRISGSGKETFEDVYEYNKDGDLIKSVHKKFEPTGEDRTYTYDEYWESENGLITSGGYDGIKIPAFSADDYLKKNKSSAYEKVTKAQHDFFYNTLIYYIIDTSEDVL